MDVNHNIAVLIANGFDEKHLSVIQKTLRENGVGLKMVSSENGVVNGWANNEWGCFFPVDASISTALASDYDGIVVMGGSRSIARLEKTAHTQRFINSFLRVEKPVMAIDEASSIVDSENNDVIKVDTTVSEIKESMSSFVALLGEYVPEMDMAA